MPRKIKRSNKEEEEIRKNRRERNAERQRQYRLKIGTITFEENVIENYLYEINRKSIRCNANHFSGEKVNCKELNSFNDCCGHGGVILENMPEFQEKLKFLLDGSHTKSSSCRQHIPLYNQFFSFASFNANIINFPGRRPGPYSFKIQRQIYYQINTALYPEGGENPTFGQIFIYDENEALAHRLKQNTTLDIEILTIIETLP